MPRKPRSLVWVHFKRVIVGDHPMAQCLLCGGSDKPTHLCRELTVMEAHLSSEHPGWKDPKPSTPLREAPVCVSIPASPQSTPEFSAAEFISECREGLLQAASKKAPAATPSRRKEARERAALLSTSSDVHGVSFAGRDFQQDYLLRLFQRRAALVHGFFAAVWGGPSPLRTAVVACLSLEARLSQGNCSDLQIVSHGGGPGTDVTGVVAASRELFGYGGAPVPTMDSTSTIDSGRAVPKSVVLVGSTPQPMLRLHLLDYEATWRSYLGALQTLYAPLNCTLGFGRCDVTQPLLALPDEESLDPDAPYVYRPRPLNTGLAGVNGVLSTADLHLFSYVCHETSRAAEAGGYAYYRDLVSIAKPGTLFLFFDVQQRSESVYNCIEAAMRTALAACPDSGRTLVRHVLSLAVQAKTARSSVCVLQVQSDRED
ncbi:hypothetical protein KIPB_004478 [Kipferlia bialata]|uniref:Uncharacterized protein n=1 Tax=Kipferlia bialata TaxID=797122 RepID=A0A9K3CTT7_9EUKA|nr:hypothetical protein KIPB_004478 [Kipferlia bialata]|eukprot:g4478.t1